MILAARRTSSFNRPMGGNQIAKKIRSFSNLRAGWHYGQGGPILEDRINKAIKIHALLKYIGFLETDAFPGVDGEILLTCYFGNHYIEILVDTAGEISIYHEKDSDVVEELKHVREAELVLSKMVGDIWNSSGSFISNITIRGEGDLTNWRSKTLRMDLEHQSLKWNVFERDELPRANISKNSMLMLQAIQPYSGNSTQKFYPPTII
jgi:hypothetical protein